MRAGFLSLVAVSLVSAAFPSLSQAIQPTVKEVSDVRSTDDEKGYLEVALGVKGDEAADVRAMRATVISAVDEAGRDLTNVSTASRQGQRFVALSKERPTLPLLFRNPLRRASVMRELIGRLDVFIPSNDPESLFIVDAVQEKVGATLDSGRLRNAEVEVVPLLAADASRESGTSFTASGSGLVLKVKDPEGKLVAATLVLPNGERKASELFVMPDSDDYFAFDVASIAGAKLELLLVTAKSTVRLPFNFENVLLP